MSAPILSVSDYDHFERLHRMTLSNDAIRAFQPVALNEAGFPTRVVEEEALARYVEVADPDLPMEKLLYEERYTVDESETLSHIAGTVGDLTANLFGRRIAPWMGPLAATKLARIVGTMGNAVRTQTGKPQLTVVEINPGSGYLGAHLIRQGHRYIAVEFSQALYLWQNRLFGALAPGQFVDFADAPSVPAVVSEQVAHMPWWHFARQFEHGAIDADLLICENGFGDMHRFAIRYVFKLARTMFRDSRLALMIYDRLGPPAVNPPGDMTALAFHFGWQILFSELFNGYYMPEKTPLDLDMLRRLIPPYNPSGRHGKLRGTDFLQVEDSQVSSRPFLSYIGAI